MSVFIVMCVLEEKKTQIKTMQWGERKMEKDNNKNQKKKKKSSIWDLRSCVVCEGPIWNLTAESCVYYRWNNLSYNGTANEILGRCASRCASV